MSNPTLIPVKVQNYTKLGPKPYASTGKKIHQGNKDH